MSDASYADELHGQGTNKARGKRIYNSYSDKAYMIFVNTFLIIALIVVVVPLLFVLASSFSSSDAVAAGRVFLWPVEPSLEGYKAVFRNDRLIRGFLNTIFYAVANIVLNLVMLLLAAYPLAKKDLKYKKYIVFLFSFTMFFSGGMIPSYLVIRSLGMIDTVWAMIIPSAMSIWNVIVTRTYFQSNIPYELFECASIDGCGDFIYLWKVVVPLSKPILAVMALFVGIGIWNSYFSALLYLQNYELYPLQLVLRDILILGDTGSMLLDVKDEMERQQLQQLLKYSTMVISSVPVMLIYPFVQKYFVKGVMVGSLKG